MSSYISPYPYHLKPPKLHQDDPKTFLRPLVIIYGPPLVALMTYYIMCNTLGGYHSRHNSPPISHISPSNQPTPMKSLVKLNITIL